MLVKSNVLIDVCSDRRALGKDDVFAMHEEKHRCNWEKEHAAGGNGAGHGARAPLTFGFLRGSKRNTFSI